MKIGKPDSTRRYEKLSVRLTEIEQVLKKIEMQLDTTEPKDSCFDINNPIEKIVVGGINAYREIIYNALSVAFSDILGNSREIERTDRIGDDFHEAINGGSEINRILSNITDKYGKKVISRREKEILANLLWGRSNKEISLELEISEKTVKNHLWKIYQKLGVNSRTQLLHKIFFERKSMSQS